MTKAKSPFLLLLILILILLQPRFRREQEKQNGLASPPARLRKPKPAQFCADLADTSKHAASFVLRTYTRPLLTTGVDQHLPVTVLARLTSV
jgi:hypothetical protein